MDVFAHALWTNIVYQKSSPGSRWWAIFFGIAPDIFSFGLFIARSLLAGTFVFHTTPPAYVAHLYQYTHSLVIWGLVFVGVAIIRGLRHHVAWNNLPWLPWWPLVAWALHIVIDIFTHSLDFFPTPFLFPLFDIRVDAISWTNQTFMVTNYALLLLAYLDLLRRWRQKKYARAR